MTSSTFALKLESLTSFNLKGFFPFLKTGKKDFTFLSGRSHKLMISYIKEIRCEMLDSFFKMTGTPLFVTYTLHYNKILLFVYPRLLGSWGQNAGSSHEAKRIAPIIF